MIFRKTVEAYQISLAPFKEFDTRKTATMAAINISLSYLEDVAKGRKKQLVNIFTHPHKRILQPLYKTSERLNFGAPGVSQLLTLSYIMKNIWALCVSAKIGVLCEKSK